MPGAEPAQGPLHDSIGSEILAPDLILCRGQAEENEGRNPERLQLIYFLVQPAIHRELEDTRHRGDLAGGVRPVDHEGRRDKVLGSERRLPGQAA